MRKKSSILPFGRAGFTLIELMITVSIVGILSLIGRAKFINYSEQLKVRQARTQMKVLEMALKSHYKDTGNYPPAYGRGGLGGNIYNLGNRGDTATGGGNGGSEFLTVNGVGANWTMAPWEWTLIRGQKDEGFPGAVPAGWMGPYLLSAPNDPWGHRYILEDWDKTSNSDTMIVCLGPKGFPNGMKIPAGNPVGGYVLTSLEKQKSQTQWLDKEGFSIIPRNANTALLPDFMRPMGILPNIGDDDYNIVLWLE